MTEEEEERLEDEDEEESSTVTLKVDEKSILLASTNKEFTMKVQSMFDSFEQDMHGIQVESNNNKSQFLILVPRTFLPLTLQILFGFDVDDVALKISIYYDKQKKIPISKIEVEQPHVGSKFSGSALISDAIINFLKPEYKPRTSYRSAPFILVNRNVQPRQAKIKEMTDKGYDRMQSCKALSHCNNDVDKSIRLLRKGEFEGEIDVSSTVKYDENPLIYLVLEITECVFDLQDHCALCRSDIPRCLKPTACEKQICQIQSSAFGLSGNALQEIKRDVNVADLIFSFFASAIGTKFLTPSPPPLTKQQSDELIESYEQNIMARQLQLETEKEKLNHNPDYLLNLVKKIKQFSDIAKFSNDSDLKKALGNEQFNLLRWVLMTNRTQLFHLPPSLELSAFQNRDGTHCMQFMSLMSTPEQESIFQQMKAKYGSIFLWHGSDLNKWHSIIRNGLIDGSKHGMVLNGARHGSGIYFAPDSGTSNGYSDISQNGFPNSELGKTLSVIALCEVINLPKNENLEIKVKVQDPVTKQIKDKVLEGFLKNHNWCLTLTIEEACIVRFLFVNFNQDVNVLKNPPTLPTFDEIVDYLIESRKNTTNQ